MCVLSFHAPASHYFARTPSSTPSSPPQVDELTTVKETSLPVNGIIRVRRI